MSLNRGLVEVKEIISFSICLKKFLNFLNLVYLETSANQDERLFILLLFLFPRYLRNAMRKGLFKTYICKKYNDGSVRSIDVARHIKKSLHSLDIAYSKREYCITIT